MIDDTKSEASPDYEAMAKACENTGCSCVGSNQTDYCDDCRLRRAAARTLRALATSRSETAEELERETETLNAEILTLLIGDGEAGGGGMRPRKEK